MRRLLCLWLMLLLTGSLTRLAAQEATPTAVVAGLAGTLLRYGEVVSGRLDNRTPQTIYTFEGLRGEYVTVRLRATDNTLDPVLLVLNASGQTMIYQDDADGSADALIDLIEIPRSGVYYVIAARFGGNQGSTSGGYELVIERQGVSFASGSALRYGDTVANRISDETPEVYYTFRAERGDIVTLTMRRDSGALDPVVRIVTRDRLILAENDDMTLSTGQPSQDARIDSLVIQASDTYIIVATRYGTESGGFLLTLERADDSGEGASALVAIPLRPGQPTEGDIDSAHTQVYYSFSASRDDIVTLRMNRVSGSLDPLVVVTNAGLQELARNDDLSESTRNAEITDFRVPADGLYYVIATRFEGDAGTTTGRYRLELVARGNVFAGISGTAGRLSYGTSAGGSISSAQQEVLFAFYGVEGDVITAAMTRGQGSTLQPALTILNEAREQVAAAAPVAGSEDAVRVDRYTLPGTGLYYLRAARRDGESSGTFVVALAQRFD